MDLNAPLLIVVNKSEWKAIPSNRIGYSPRELALLSELKTFGGIDTSVPPGWYYFNMTLQNGEPIFSFFPANPN